MRPTIGKRRTPKRQLNACRKRRSPCEFGHGRYRSQKTSYIGIVEGIEGHRTRESAPRRQVEGEGPPEHWRCDARDTSDRSDIDVERTWQRLREIDPLVLRQPDPLLP